MRMTALITLILAALPAPAFAFSASDDHAHLFSAEAAAEATAILDQVREAYGKDLRIRTYDTVPWYKARVPKDDEARERYFTRWAEDKARFIDGTLILICKHPLEVRVVVHFRGRTRPFTPEDGQGLQEELTTLLKENKNDEALLHSAEFFRKKLYGSLGDTFASFDWPTLCSVLGAVIGAWLALYFLHGFSESTFQPGSAAINPLGLGSSVGVFAGLQAVRAELARPAGTASPQAGTILEDRPPPVDRFDRTEGEAGG